MVVSSGGARLLFYGGLALKRVASWVRVSVVEGTRGEMSGVEVVAQRARWRLSAAARMRASQDAVCILKLWGSHLTVLTMRVELVDGVQTL